jgi:hypothetical protein
MVNIWDYANELPRIKLKTVNGTELIGNVVAVFDADEIESAQDCIDVELDNGEIKSFFPEDIESIEVLT